MSRTEIAELYGNSVFNFLWNLYTISHSGCTNLQFHQQCTRVPLYPPPRQHLFVVFLMRAILTRHHLHFREKKPHTERENAFLKQCSSKSTRFKATDCSKPSGCPNSQIHTGCCSFGSALLSQKHICLTLSDSKHQYKTSVCPELTSWTQSTGRIGPAWHLHV